MPDGHPVIFRYNPPLPPLAASAFPWARCTVPTLPRPHFYEEEGGATVYVGEPAARRTGMTIDRPAVKQRRLTETVVDLTDSVVEDADAPATENVVARAAQAVAPGAAQIGKSADRPVHLSDEALAKLRDQLDAVIQQRRGASSDGPASDVSSNGGDCSAGFGANRSGRSR